MSAAEIQTQGPFLDSVQSNLSPQIREKASQTLGEDFSQVNEGFNVAIPTVLAGIARKGSTRHGAAEFLSYIHHEEFQKPLTRDQLERQIHETASDPLSHKVGGMLDEIFGDKLNAITQAITKITGMKSASTASILDMVTIVAVGVLRRKVPATRSSRDLQNYLVAQKPVFLAALPAEINALLSSAGERTTAGLGQRRVWPWLIAALALLTVSGIWLNRMNRAQQPASVGGPAATLYSGDNTPIMLQGSLENLRIYLDSGSDAELPKRFRFDDLYFDISSSTLDSNARDTVEQIALILNQHPSARILLEGHADSVGDEGANLRLSGERAQAMKDMLVGLSVDGRRIEVAGRGDTQPFVANDSDSNRNLNRRIDLIVTHR
jgi:outer membrane protein OmpA-like peptidoglycan-associated protein